MWRAKNDPTNSQGKKCFELRISWYAEEKISVDREECYMFMKPCFQFIIRFCTVKLAKLKKSESERELKQSVEMWNAWMKNSWTETVEASERRKRILANLFRVPRFLRMSLIIRWAVQESAFPKNVGVRSFKARQTHVFILFDEHPKKNGSSFIIGRQQNANSSSSSSRCQSSSK